MGRNSDDGPARADQRRPPFIGNIAPKLASLTDDVLFEDVWNRPGLAAAIEASSRSQHSSRAETPSSSLHLGRAKRENGVTEHELLEAITHLAFYAGWPKAMTAVTVARAVFGT